MNIDIAIGNIQNQQGYIGIRKSDYVNSPKVVMIDAEIFRFSDYSNLENHMSSWKITS